MRRVVVVGASLAGLRACETLRTEGYTGTITLIGDERHRPYDRPPLSKRFLAGEWDEQRIALRKSEPFDALGLDLKLGVPAAGLDTDARSVVLDDGTDVAYDAVIIATGTRPRTLPGTAGNPLVHVLRTIDDALALREVITRPGARLVIIGAGFIGLEVAATARAAGADVVVLEAAPAPLIRGVGAELGMELAAFHADEGVPIRCGVSVASIDSTAVVLGDGERIPADAVLVGIGVVPATEWLDGSGLEVRDGVVTAPTLAAGPPGVFAAGDIARWHHPRFDEELRIEHWTNATEHGMTAAHNLLAQAAGAPLVVADSVPFVWSDQYRHRIQFLGRSTAAGGGTAEWRIVLGSPAERRFLAVFHDGGVVRGVLGLSVPRHLMRYRELIERRAPLSEAMALASEQSAADTAKAATAATDPTKAGG